MILYKKDSKGKIRFVEIYSNENKVIQKHGIFICEHNGITFGCGMKFPHKFREEVLINKEYYIGKTAEIRFFEYTEDGIPRFPVAVGIRLDK